MNAGAQVPCVWVVASHRILLGGSDSTVHPHLYGQEPARPGFEFDTGAMRWRPS